jgi:predicted secreted protein
MSDTVARKTHGTTLWRGQERVARLLNIDPPETSRDDVDVTDHDSPEGFREFIPGLKQAGEVPVEGHLIPTDDTQTGLLAAVDNDVPEEWTIKFPTVPELRIRFNGYVKSFKVGPAPVDGKMTFNAVIKVTGKPVIETDESAGLSALTLSKGTLTPDFAGNVYEYFASVGNADDAIKVTPTADGHTITVNGAKITSGSASSDIELTAEELNPITIKAWEPDKAPKVYVVKVYRAGA